jgi:hypothetical protein
MDVINNASSNVHLWVRWQSDGIHFLIEALPKAIAEPRPDWLVIGDRLKPVVLLNYLLSRTNGTHEVVEIYSALIRVANNINVPTVEFTIGPRKVIIYRRANRRPNQTPLLLYLPEVKVGYGMIQTELEFLARVLYLYFDLNAQNLTQFQPKI